MRRLVDETLEKWRGHPRRKPLLVRGGRQVGKTHSLLALGRRSFGNTLHLDFERNPDLSRTFDKDLDPTRLIAALEVITGTRIRPGETLLFLDEIQACPRAIMSLRYFKEQAPELHVVAAGSLLEFALRDLSFPVGRIQFLEMFPMIFAEYLWAMGNSQAAEIVLSRPEIIGEDVHAHLLEELRRYLAVGGMPEAIHTLKTSGSLVDCGEVHREIIEGYRADFSKYAPRADKTCLRTVMAATARSVGQQIKYARLAEGFSNATIHRAFDLLHTARILRKIRSTSPTGLPLAAHASEKVFKALFLDVGLMQHVCGIKMDVAYASTDLVDLHRGAVAEQFVGQELAVTQGGELHYWSRPARGSSAEVDYLVSTGTDVVPVEVKSGDTGRLRSLQMLLDAYPNCRRALVFSTAPPAPADERGLQRLPLYFAYGATR